MKTELCSFSGYKVYPGHGMKFISKDAKIFWFRDSKCKRYFHSKKKPAKFMWTVTYRKMHKKGQTDVVTRKRARRVVIVKERGIVGAPIELIRKRRAQKPEERQADREAALKELQKRRQQQRQARKEKQKAATPSAQKPAVSDVKQQKSGSRPNMKGR
jgi:large subunit ribosomal protein L24e